MRNFFAQNYYRNVHFVHTNQGKTTQNSFAVLSFFQAEFRLNSFFSLALTHSLILCIKRRIRALFETVILTEEQMPCCKRKVAI